MFFEEKLFISDFGKLAGKEKYPSLAVNANRTICSITKAAIKYRTQRVFGYFESQWLRKT